MFSFLKEALDNVAQRLNNKLRFKLLIFLFYITMLSCYLLVLSLFFKQRLFTFLDAVQSGPTIGIFYYVFSLP